MAAGWKPEWSEAFFKCVEQNPDAKALFKRLSDGEFSDVGAGKKWCSNSDVFRPSNALLMGLGTLKIAAGSESSYKPTDKNFRSPNPPAVGLFQIGPTDSQMVDCKGLNGERITKGKGKGSGQPSLKDLDREATIKALEDPGNNICCAVALAAYEAKKKKTPPLQFGSSIKSVFGRHWAVMREDGAKGSKGGDTAEKLQRACTTIGQPNELFSAAEVDKARNGKTDSVQMASTEGGQSRAPTSSK